MVTTGIHVKFKTNNFVTLGRTVKLSQRRRLVAEAQATEGPARYLEKSERLAHIRAKHSGSSKLALFNDDYAEKLAAVVTVGGKGFVLTAFVFLVGQKLTTFVVYKNDFVRILI